MGPKMFNFYMNDFCWLFSEAILITAICESMDGVIAHERFEDNQMKANLDKC